ncbi:neuronal pentraxin receptor-like [Lingula anatina]|uniref:Pentraxin family member n=1 Tax=Lingula anatina TaxID=7574 RepID=A0A1S3IEG6_LINAN|nr:neuronal pentraxin receptor-like [Lingula anatina]|eukprot:XP_013396543.1 neuronal pentraxin receptor-like [Lingula anatina]
MESFAKVAQSIRPDPSIGESTILRWPSPQTVKSYVKLHAVTPAMTAMTACMRVKSAFIGNGVTYLLSYATASAVDTFLLGYSGNGAIVLNLINSGMDTSVTKVYDSFWHHWCFSWNNYGGKWTLYMDGMPAASGNSYRSGWTVPENGVWIVGQDQDTSGGGFVATQAYVGDITSINVWNTDNVDVAAVANCGDKFGGNVISWHVVAKEIHEVSTYREDLCKIRDEE